MNAVAPLEVPKKPIWIKEIGFAHSNVTKQSGTVHASSQNTYQL